VKLDPFIEAEEAADRSVKHCCDMFEVSRAAYYQRQKQIPSARAVSDGELVEKIRQIHDESEGSYGSPRVHKELLARGVACGRRRVRRLMVREGLEGRCKKRWRKTTIQDPAAEAEALDLIQRHFGPSEVLDARYVGDVTYVATWEGWAYLATVIDLASRKVVGWALADHMRTELVSDALMMAFGQRRPPAGAIFHSDRGAQYTSRDFRHLASDHGIVMSLGRKGTCWDNAVAESFFASIKRELIDRRPWPTITDLHRAVFDWIEGWYNTRRLHSSLGYLSPAQYETRIHQNVNSQAA
jgi:transposase InsO family protein